MQECCIYDRNRTCGLCSCCFRFFAICWFELTCRICTIIIQKLPQSDMLFLIARNLLCRISQTYCLLTNKRTSENWLSQTNYLLGRDGHKTLRNKHPDSHYFSFVENGPKLPQHLLVSMARVDSFWHLKNNFTEALKTYDVEIQFAPYSMWCACIRVHSHVAW